jgi:glutathione S-transferase
MALAHKGLAHQTRAIKFTEADRIAFSGQGKVPVLVDGETTVHDSWAIACYLEDAYPEAPSLFGGDPARMLTFFVNHWVDRSLQAALSPILAPCVYDAAHADDKAYYRETREARYGRSIETLRGERAQRLPALDRALEPLRARLEDSPFVCGDAPAYGDYLVFAEFQWARCVSPDDPLTEDERNRHVRAWRERMLDLFDGLARAMPAYADEA